MVRHRAASRGAGETLVLAGIATLAVVAALALPGRAGAAEARRGGTPTGQHEAALEAELDARLQHTVELIYSSRLSEARREADAARALAPQDPRVYLMAARLLRESFPDQSSTGESLERFSAPIHAELGRAMQLCDSILACDPSRAAASLYRGWAHLFAAQMHALCDELWSAGRHAKRGKEDLDRALELDPGNRDGQGILGTYLYFADVLPGAVKLARTVAGIPGGDKTLGREMLRASAAGAGYNRFDAQALLGAIAVGFEGDYAASRRVFEALLVDFPTSPRLAEPLAVLDLFAPEHAQLERTARLASWFATDSEDWYRQLSQRLTLYQSLLEMVVGRVDEALAHLEEVRRTGPLQPDWIPNDIVLCITEMHLLVGEPAPVLTLSTGGYARQFTKLLQPLQEPGAVASPAQAATFRRTQEAARALYAGDVPAARRLLDALGTADDPAVHFYRGELSRLGGDAPQAARHYKRLTEEPLPARWRLYKTLAFSRLAEMRGPSAPAEAEDLLERAITFNEGRDLLRHFLRTRRRYFDLRASVDERPRAAAAAAGTSAAID